MKRKDLLYFFKSYADIGKTIGLGKARIQQTPTIYLEKHTKVLRKEVKKRKKTIDAAFERLISND